LYAILGAVIAVGGTFLTALAVVLAVIAGKAIGLSGDDLLGVGSFFLLALGGGMLGWSYATSREP
jgi:hypothetical protein